jgi:hypothetical protein
MNKQLYVFKMQLFPCGDIKECKKLECVSRDLWHKVHVKFQEFLSISSRVIITRVRNGIGCEDVGLGWVRLG